MEALPHHSCAFRSCRVQLHVQILPEHVDSIEGADDREGKLRSGKHGSTAESLPPDTQCPALQPPLHAPKVLLREIRLKAPGIYSLRGVQSQLPKPLVRCRSSMPHLLTGGGAAAAAPAEQGDPAGGREAQQVNRASRPLLPHLEATPGGLRCGFGSRRYSSRPTRWLEPPEGEARWPNSRLPQLRPTNRVRVSSALVGSHPDPNKDGDKQCLPSAQIAPGQHHILCITRKKTIA